MKVEDLKSLSSKIIAYAEKQATEEYYQNLLNLLQQILHGIREQPVSEQKNKLFKSLRSFDQTVFDIRREKSISDAVIR